MIILPIGEESPAETPTPHRPEVAITTVKLLALGFTPSERKLIQGVVALSHRRSLHIDLVESDTWTVADVVLLDGSDAKVVAWATNQPRLQKMAVIWVDGPQAPMGGTTQLKRPLQWPCLPAYLQRALGLEITESARVPLSAH